MDQRNEMIEVEVKSDPVVRQARTTVATAAGKRVKLVGTTTALPEYLITSRGGACMVPIDVCGEHYRIIVQRGRKPWMLQPGTMVGSIGTLRGDLLLADSFWKYGGRGVGTWRVPWDSSANIELPAREELRVKAAVTQTADRAKYKIEVKTQ